MTDSDVPGAFRRIAYFEFAPELEPAAEQELHAIVADWPDAMPWLRDLQFGRPSRVTHQGEGTTPFLLSEDFPDGPALDRYQHHPAHLALRAFLHAHPYRSQVFDLPLGSIVS